MLKALSLKEQSRGPDHPEVAAVLSSLGGLFRKEANYARSESCYRRALSIDIRNYGWQHPDTALDENSLAGLLRDMGRYAEAEPLNIRSLNTRKLLLGLSHPETARSLLGLGQLRLAQGRELEALALIKQALSVDRQVYASENHPDCADCLNALSVLYRHDNKFDLALQAIRRCLNIRLARLAADHPDLAEAYFNQGEIFLLQHDYTQAEPLFLQAKLIQEKVLGNRHPALALTLQALAAVQARKNGCK